MVTNFYFYLWLDEEDCFFGGIFGDYAGCVGGET